MSEGDHSPELVGTDVDDGRDSVGGWYGRDGSREERQVSEETLESYAVVRGLIAQINICEH